MTEAVAPSIEDGIKFEPIHDLFPSLDFFLLKSVVMKDPLLLCRSTERIYFHVRLILFK